MNPAACCFAATKLTKPWWAGQHGTRTSEEAQPPCLTQAILLDRRQGGNARKPFPDSRHSMSRHPATC